MKIVWVVTDGAFVVLVVMITIMMIVVVIAVMVVVMVIAVMMIIVAGGRGCGRMVAARVVVIGKRRAPRKKPQTNCDYQQGNETDD